MIKAVVFDIGGVLAQDVWENLLPYIASKYSLDYDEVYKVGKLLWKEFACLQGNNYQALEKQYWQKFIESLWDKKPPSNISEEKFIHLTEHFINPVGGGMVELLEKLQSQKINLAICSNNNEFWFRRQWNKLELHRFFSLNKVILSCRVGVQKPDFKMFRKVVKALGVEKSKCVFVDDRCKNIKCAEEFGMVGVLFEDVKQLDKALQEQFAQKKKDLG